MFPQYRDLPYIYIKYILFTCAIQATLPCMYQQDQHLRGISIQNGIVGCDMDPYHIPRDPYHP